MIKKLLTGALVISLGGMAQQVQNPGFETWSGGFPSGWGSIGQMATTTFGTNPNTDVQTTSVHSGSFAMLMQNQFFAGANSNIPGGINTGPITFSGQPVPGRQAYSSQPVSYDFWYKFNAINGDSAATVLYLTKWNTGLNKRDTVAMAADWITGAVSVYTHKTVTIYWLMPGTAPDSIQLSFTSSDRNVGSTNPPPTGGQLYLDDVNMNLNIGVQTIEADGSFATVYPNPANSFLNISTNGLDAGEAKIYDLTGNLIGTYALTGRLSQISISDLESGIYIYSVRDEKSGKVFTSRFSVSK